MTDSRLDQIFDEFSKEKETKTSNSTRLEFTAESICETKPNALELKRPWNKLPIPDRVLGWEVENVSVQTRMRVPQVGIVVRFRSTPRSKGSGSVLASYLTALLEGVDVDFVQLNKDRIDVVVDVTNIRWKELTK